VNQVVPLVKETLLAANLETFATTLMVNLSATLTMIG